MLFRRLCKAIKDYLARRRAASRISATVERDGFSLTMNGLHRVTHFVIGESYRGMTTKERAKLVFDLSQQAMALVDQATARELQAQGPFGAEQSACTGASQ